ncbi:MAG: hypothetical protein PHC91_05545 [Eubacteriales bacterium]|nr:hypothetical protein [Eubacteriales bacterium]
MTDAGLKSLLALLLRNKDVVVSLLDNFKPDDIERGILAIPEDMISRDIKMLIMDKAGDYLNDYALHFLQDAIFVDLDVQAKQLGRLKAKYMLNITRLDFSGNTHKIKLSYREDVKSAGNFMQNMAVKAAGLKGSYLQTATEIMRLDFIRVEQDTITIDLDMPEFAKKIPPTLNISYVSSEDGILKLKFHVYFA